MHRQIGHGLAGQLADQIVNSARAGTAERQAAALPTSMFKELDFIRLGDNWREKCRDSGLWGGVAFDHKIFRQFELALAPRVTLDFWFRGFYLSPSSGRAFFETLRYAHGLTGNELTNLVEVLGVVGDGLVERKGHVPVSRIICAEVGSLKGRMVLAVRWEHLKLGRVFSSLFIDADCDGRTVHEIHFSAPSDAFERHLGSAHEAFRSIQWRSASMPPLSGCA